MHFCISFVSASPHPTSAVVAEVRSELDPISDVLKGSPVLDSSPAIFLTLLDGVSAVLEHRATSDVPGSIHIENSNEVGFPSILFVTFIFASLMVNFYLALADLLADGFVPLATFAAFSVEGTTGRTMYAYHETPGGKQTAFVSFSIIHFCLNRRRFSTRLLFMSCDEQSGRNQTRFDLSYFIQCWGRCCSFHRLR